MTKEVLVLGTRKSLLAQAQSRWVAQEIQKISDQNIQLKGIITEGDQILDIPLSQIDGKEFFVKALDDELLAGTTDYSVHSMKDLALERPEGIRIAAIPPRENPRDVIWFHPRTIEKLQTGTPLRIGTSSPRRLENTPVFLKDALPRWEHTPQVQFVEIRGNVNTRLKRLSDDGERQLDGVVLAMAGLNRLALDDDALDELRHLTSGLLRMVLPLDECPTAPAQGALMVECLKGDSGERAFQSAQALHCTITEGGKGACGCGKLPYPNESLAGFELKKMRKKIFNLRVKGEFRVLRF